MEHVIDVKGKSLGRAASEAAAVLRGKNSVGFSPNAVPEITVKILNANKVKMDEKTVKQKQYTRYSGYPGGIKKIKMSNVFAKDPGEVFKKAVWGMLPKNKLRKRFIKNLVIEK